MEADMLQINTMAKPCQKPRKLEKPGSRLPRACKVPDAEWTKFRRIIEDLYARTDLKTVMATMTSEHGFDASKQQYKIQFAKWAFNKNRRRPGPQQGHMPPSLPSPSIACLPALREPSPSSQTSPPLNTPSLPLGPPEAQQSPSAPLQQKIPTATWAAPIGHVQPIQPLEASFQVNAPVLMRSKAPQNGTVTHSPVTKNDAITATNYELLSPWSFDQGIHDLELDATAFMSRNTGSSSATTPDYDPVHYPIRTGSLPTIMLMVDDNPQCVRAVTRSGKSCVYLAAEFGHLNILEFMIWYKVDLNLAIPRVRWYPIHIAAFKGHTEVVDLLLKRAAEPDACTVDGRTPLWLAAHQGHYEIVKLLLDAKTPIDIEAKCQDRRPLHQAAQNGHSQIVLALLEPRTFWIQGLTPLCLASANGHQEVVRSLLEQGAKLDTKRDDGKTQLFTASDRGHFGVVKLLLQHGASPQTNCGPHGATSLHIASQRGHQEVVKILLEHGAGVDAKGSDDITPLMLASQNGHQGVVRLLLQHGASILAKRTSSEATSLHFASQNGHHEVVQLLQQSASSANESLVGLN
ncbi:hypothetical protein QC762_310870 [Podospora pseudocomata]|uniref:Clr5 domain-containing protein n=1 Tax=Podospora pseudocomata TaxID=2093779 RepID=A0ABR0GKZ0_9PEZI|nr:hypothetical protein QC762_310870 [Podospora pseudocomata]